MAARAAMVVVTRILLSIRGFRYNAYSMLYLDNGLVNEELQLLSRPFIVEYNPVNG